MSDHCSAIRAMASLLLATGIAVAVVSIGVGSPAVFADFHVFQLQSTTTVGSLSGRGLAPAVRLDPPSPSTPVNRSTCRTDLVGQVMSITIPDISYSCPVYGGGQATLDSGAAAQITDPAIQRVLADRPGGAGLLWIAGHRTSHGGAFAAVPDLADGAAIAITDGTFSATYRIVGRLYVTVINNRVVDASGQATGAATLDSIIRPDHGGNGASRLLLQTCDGDNHRWMIYADLVTG